MRQVFLKEWRQGHLIAMFGLLLGGLVVALWGILTVAWVRDWRDQEAVDAFAGVMYYLVPLLLAIFVGSGLFAAEVERGTAPLLLALPFSRRRMWLGKALAGLALMVSAVVLVLLPAAIAVRPALEEVRFWEFLPELALASALLFVSALFWSTVLTTIVSAFLSAIATVAALLVFAVLMMVFGGRLFGPAILDLEIWALASIPGLLAGSYLSFARGGVFRSRRRWGRPLAVAFSVYLVTILGLIAFIRATTRYDRKLVQRVALAELTGRGSAASVQCSASPVQLTREVEAKMFAPGDAGYRRTYAVALDLDTGEELLARREADVVNVSPDRTHAFALTGPRPITWRGRPFDGSGRLLEIWELEPRRMTYRGFPRGFLGPEAARIQSAFWSPDGKWIMLTSLSQQANERETAFVRLDGTVAHRITTPQALWDSGAWDWAPNGDAIYWLDGAGVLSLRDLSTKRSQPLWRADDARLLLEDSVVRSGWISASPDGQWVAVALGARATAYVGSPTLRDVLVVVRTDGSDWRLVSDDREAPAVREALAWTADSQTLYSVTRSRARETDTVLRVVVWRATDAQPAGLTLPLREGMIRTAVLADGRLLLWSVARGWTIDANGRAVRLAPPVETALAESTLVGVDRAGRLLVEKWEGEHRSYLAALDPSTGRLTPIYP